MPVHELPRELTWYMSGKAFTFFHSHLYVAILLGMLKKRPEAARHYINFLKQLKAWKELHTLYA